MAHLTRDDIVPKKLRAIYRSNAVSIEGIVVARGFVELADGIIFELQSQDPLMEYPIERFSGDLLDALGCQRIDSFEDAYVTEILTSERWPSLGIAINDAWFLCLSDDATPFVVEPFLSEIGTVYDRADVLTYYGHSALTD